MKSDLVETTGLNTGYIRVKSGSDSKGVAAGLTHLAGFAGGQLLSKVPFFSTAISLFKAFCNAYGTTWATGSTGDFVQVRLIYDKMEKFTYKQMGSQWRLGLCTQKATIRSIATEQYYYNVEARTGRTHSNSRNVSTVFQSPDFAYPWARAYQYAPSILEEWMSWKCGTVNFAF